MFDKLKARFRQNPTFNRWWARRFGDYEDRLLAGVIPRPNYAYCVYHGARLAKRLGYTRMSAIEFGVAGGNGLLALEQHAAMVSELTQIEIEVYGFDTGEGLPSPVDYRDLPYHWKSGFYKMDVGALKSKLQRAKLVLGEVSETLPSFCETHRPAPIGAISFDLDFYSSTRSAMNVLLAKQQFLLPRIFCYFDDTIGTETEAYSDFTGQRLAINEFNDEHAGIKLGFPYCLLNGRVRDSWRHQIWVAHLFTHPHYNSFVSSEGQALPMLAR